MTRPVLTRALPALLVVMACGISERRVEERSELGAGNNAGGATPVSAGGAFGASSGAGGTGFVPGGTAFGPNGGAPPMPMGGYPVGGKADVPPDMPPIGIPPLSCPVLPEEAFDATCILEPSVGQGGAGNVETDWCDPGSAAPGAGGVTGAEGEGGAGGVADSGPPSSDHHLLIDDFEDGDTASLPVLGGLGQWFVVNDGSGQQFPMPCARPSVSQGGLLGDRAMHTYGQGFRAMPGGYSLVGLTVRSGAPACDQSIDASKYDGVEFWIRGSGTVRFFISTVATNPVADAGTCEAGCYDAHGVSRAVVAEWKRVRVPFSTLVQEGWGYPADFDPSKILTIQWSAKLVANDPTPANCFDFWIDEVAFYAD